ncbi:hypothetical protein EEL49_00455 [Muribaculaceae bacterium Isolate-104 (HZI)]|nr:hypothetical protein EEL49_00455 [Muribaculaceae bacterium Isolate-104 (HZI)]
MGGLAFAGGREIDEPGLKLPLPGRGGGTDGVLFTGGRQLFAGGLDPGRVGEGAKGGTIGRIIGRTIGPEFQPHG